MVLLTLKWLRSFWGHWVHFDFQKTVSGKGLVIELNSEIWASGVSINCAQDTFDTSVIKVILGSFDAF